MCFVCSGPACVFSVGLSFASGQGAFPRVVLLSLRTSMRFLGWACLLLGPRVRFLRLVCCSFGSACVDSGGFAPASGLGVFPRVVLFQLRTSVLFLGLGLFYLWAQRAFSHAGSFLCRAFVRFLGWACFFFGPARRFCGRGSFLQGASVHFLGWPRLRFGLDCFSVGWA